MSSPFAFSSSTTSSRTPAAYCYLERHLQVQEGGCWFLDFISRWLSVPALTALDAAITSRSLRPAWLNLLRQSKNPSLQQLPFFSHMSLRWIITRGIGGVREMRVSRNHVASGPGDARHETQQHSFLGAQWPDLQSLSIDDDVRLDYTSDSIWAACPGLLSVSASGQTFNMSSALEGLARHCRRLEKLSLRQCGPSLWDDALAAVRVNLRSLCDISLQGASRITDKAIMELVCGGLTRIRKLNLNQCSGLTNAAVLMIANTCPALESLAIADMSRTLSDAAICGLALKAKKLREIVLNRNYALTDRSLEALVRGCPKLEAVYCGQCISMTTQCIERCQEKNPRLKIVSSV